MICSSCGQQNPEIARFCNACGHKLENAAAVASPQAYTPQHLAEKILTSGAALVGERKQVTVLFADLKGSMELLAGRDPEEARRLLERRSPTRTTPRAPAMPRSACRQR